MNKHTFIRFTVFSLCLLLVTGILVTGLSNHSYGKDDSEQVNVPLDGATVIQTDSPIDKVVTGQTDKIDVKVKSTREIIVFGLKEGPTTLHVWTNAGLKQYMLVVAPAASQSMGDQLRNVLVQDGETKEGLELRVYSPEYRDVTEFEKYVSQLLKDKGKVLLADAPSGKLFVMGPSDLLDKIDQLLDRLDVPGEEKIYTKRIVLENRPVTQLEEGIKELLTEEGKVILDRETNSVLLVDKVSKVNSIENYLRDIDQPTVSQVRIHARFVEIADDVSNQLGIDWRINDGENADVQYNTRQPGASSLVTSPLGGLEFDVLGAPDVAARLRALEEKDLLNLISAPNVVTRNQQKATLEIQNKTSYVSGCEISSVEGATTVVPTIDTLTDGITLNVTPLIGKNRVIQLDVIPELRIGDLVGGGVIDDCAFDNKEVDIRRAELNVALMDGQTLVIGGLSRKQDNKQTSSVPAAADIPIIGEFLFANTNREAVDRDITIFITAEIVELEPDKYDESDTIPPTPQDDIKKDSAPKSEAQDELLIEQELF